jgi:hypothetical protein
MKGLAKSGMPSTCAVVTVALSSVKAVAASTLHAKPSRLRGSEWCRDEAVVVDELAVVACQAEEPTYHSR